MRWGVRKEKEKPSGKSFVVTKQQVATGAAIDSSYIRATHVKLAVEQGKKMADLIRKSDAADAKRYSWLNEHKDDHYDKIVQEYAERAKKDKISTAYKNVRAYERTVKKR